MLLVQVELTKLKLTKDRKSIIARKANKDDKSKVSIDTTC